VSCVYEGWVRHRRFEPVEHAFRYRIRLLYADVEAEAVLDLVEERTGQRPAGPVRLLTQPRRLGVGFNPVSFYFCFDGEDRVEAVAAEVTSTPWGERHTYVLPGRSGVLEKRLHVSPFLGMDGEYAWRVSEPGETLHVHIENRESERTVFDATLSLRRRAPGRAGHPLAVLARIYLQAARLKLRGVPVHRHP
jgi:DUF1365 family protein